MEIARTAPDALLLLWRDKFFLKQQTVAAVREALAKRGYNFEDHTLMMALKSAKFLTRRGSTGKFNYIQKHPFLEEKKHGRGN